MLLHGVGVGPESFDRLAAVLRRGPLGDRCRVVAAPRPTGFDGSALTVEEQADRIAAEQLGSGRAIVVGVSGGATVGVALGIRHPEAVGALALHEPLLGRNVAGLHQQFTEAAARAAESEDEAMTVVRAVMGEPTWAALDAPARRRAEASAGRWRDEIARFAAFDPSPADVASLHGLPVLATYGARSAPVRQQAAAVLASLAGAEVAVVAGAGNAAHLDAPDALARVLEAWAPVAAGAA